MTEPKIQKKTMLILAGALLASCVLIFYRFLFGNSILAYFDVGADTYDQYLMHYQTIINHLREGSFSLWDFNNGYGTNMYSLNLFDPFLMLLYAAGVLAGPEKIYGLLVYVQILRIVLAGFAIYGFLSCFCLSERSKLIASYAYALSGYMVVWGQHYHFGTLMVLFPLLLLAAEKSFQKTRGYLYLTLVCAVCCLCSVYFSYMQFLVLGFYFLFRISWRGKLFSLNGMKTLGKAYGSMILGIGAGLINLLPSANLILRISGRVTAAPLLDRIRGNLGFYWIGYYKTLVKRFLSSNLEGITDYFGYENYYEAPNVFMSALLLIAGVCFIGILLRKSYSRKQKALVFAALATCALALILPLGGLVFNGFAYPFSRFTFVCMPFFAWIIAEFLQETLEEQKLCLPLFGIASAGVFLLYGLIYVLGQQKYVLLLLAGTVGMAAALLAGARAKKAALRSAAVCFLCFCLGGIMSADAWRSYNERMMLGKTGNDYFEELYSSDVAKALGWLEETDTSFYRVEKDYAIGTGFSSLNALAQNYAPVSTYNSTLNTNVREFSEKLWPNLNTGDKDHYNYANAVYDNVQAALSNVKYILSKNPALDAEGYQLLKQFGKIYVYRNLYTEDFGKFYTKAIGSAEFEAIAQEIDLEKFLSQAVVCDTADKLKVPEKTMQEACAAKEIKLTAVLEQDGQNFVITLPEQKESIRLEFEMTFPQSVPYVDIKAGGYTTMVRIKEKKAHAELNIAASTDRVEISVPVTYEGEAAVTDIRTYVNEENDLASLSEGISFAACKKDSVVLGRADVKEDGILVLPMAYEMGWEAYVDGKEQEIHQTDYGFCGILLEEGSHEIKMVYKCPGFAAGAAGSAFFAGLTVLIWLGIGRHRKKEKRMETV